MTTCLNLVLSFLLSQVSLECRPPSCPPLHSPLHPLGHHGQHLHSIISTKSPCILNFKTHLHPLHSLNLHHYHLMKMKSLNFSPFSEQV